MACVSLTESRCSRVRGMLWLDIVSGTIAIDSSALSVHFSGYTLLMAGTSPYFAKNTVKSSGQRFKMLVRATCRTVPHFQDFSHLLWASHFTSFQEPYVFGYSLNTCSCCFPATFSRWRALHDTLNGNSMPILFHFHVLDDDTFSLSLPLRLIPSWLPS